MLQNVRKSSCLLQNISFGMRIFVIRTYTRYPYCFSDMSTETTVRWMCFGYCPNLALVSDSNRKLVRPGMEVLRSSSKVDQDLKSPHKTWQ